MSYIKCALEDIIYDLGPIDGLDWLLDHGWNDDDAIKLIDTFFGEI